MDSSSHTTVTVIRILHLSFFLGLVSLSAWDVSQITLSYLNDNRLTTVRRDPISTVHVPFLNRSSVCIFYNPNSPPFPGLSPSTNDYFEMMSNSWRGQEIRWTNNMTAEEISMAESIFTLILYTRVRDIDIFGLEVPTVAYFNNMSELISVIDNFITKPDIIKRIKGTWETASKKFVQTLDGPHRASLVLLDLSKVCFSLSLASQLHPIKYNYTERYGDGINQYMSYYLDLAYFQNGLTEAPSLPSASSIDLLLAGDTLSIPGDFINRTVTATVFITNGVIFDSTDFPPCSADFELEEACLLDLRMRVIADVCGCIQLSQAILKPTVTQAPLCTATAYQKCLKDASFQAEKAISEAAKAGSCKPCKSAKVHYQMFITDTDPVINLHPYYPHFLLKFELRDRMFLIFEDKRQFSVSHFVSQIGGDLGLYVGFSMMSVMQFVILIFRGCSDVNRSTRARVRRLGKLLFQRCNKAGLRNELERNKCEMNERLMDLEKTVAEMARKRM